MVIVILLSAVVLTNNPVTGVIFAEENKAASDSNQGRSKEGETKFDAHASYTKLYFDD